MTLLIIFYILLFQDVNTEACEQLFSWLSKFAIMTKQMNRWRFLLLPSVARQHTILNTRWFLQSPLDPVFRAIYVLSKSRSCVCLSGFRISGEIISFKYLNYFEGGGRESFSIAHACFLPCAREQDEKSRFLKTNGKRWKIFRKIR